MITSKVKTQSHLLYIDGIRALAALYVMIHHSVLQYYDASVYPYKTIDGYNLSLIKKSILNLFMYGDRAVSLFIVVSGYSLMLSVTKNNLSIKGGVIQFFKRRAFRILPPYYFAMLFSLLLIWLFIGDKTQTHWDISIPVNLKDVITHILLIHDFWTSTVNHINHVFWSIAVEFRIYLFFPLLIWLWKKFGMTYALLFSVLVSIIGSLLLYSLSKSNPDIALGTGVSLYIILFTFGMISADLSFSDTDRAIAVRNFYYKLSPYITILAALFLLFLATAIRHFIRPFNDLHFKEIHLESKIYDVLLGLVFALILFVCSQSRSDRNKFSFNKILSYQPLVFIGTFSYSLYLIHAPLIALLSKYIIKPLALSNFASVGLLVILGAPIIIVLSYAFFYVFEKPFLTMGKKTTLAVIEEKTIINPAP